MRATLVLLAVLGAARGAHAEPLEATVRAAVARALPDELGIVELHLAPRLAALDVDPARVAIELPAVLRAGRASVRVALPRRAPLYVPVSIAARVEVAVTARALPAGAVVEAADIVVEHRAVAGTFAAPGVVPGATTTRALPAGAAVAAADLVLPRPLARGTAITVELHTGGVHVRGAATLETTARPGEAAAARLAHTRTIVRGTLRAPATLVVAGGPR